MSIRFRIGLLLFAALLALAPPLRAASGEVYRGFTIDDSRVRRMTNLDAIHHAIEEQIDIVWAVGVPEEMMRFFQTVRFEVVPPGIIAPGNPGLYSGRTKTIQVTSIVTIAGHKPIFLHELLHALHDQRLPRGFDNIAIMRLYDDGRRIPAYAPRSHMMSNRLEFFACSGTAYLFGVTAQEPFSREKVRDNQPILYAYLQQIFGPAAGYYQGSLTEPRS